jgi:Tol biopolymer transport system component
MVTGRQAFGGASRLSVLAKILNEEPTPPSRITAAVPPELEKTILRCLRKDPARRYQTMADLKVALEDLVEDSSRATAPQPVEQAPRGRWKWALAALVPLLLIAVYFAMHTARAPGNPEPMHAVPLTSLSGQVRFPTLSPDGNQVAFTWTGAKQDNQDVYVQQIGAGAPLRLTTDPSNDSSPAWSPDGLSIAFLRRQADSNKHEVRVVPPLGGTERRIAEIEPRLPVYRPLTIAWCPDSSCLIVPDAASEGQADALFVIARESGVKRQLTFPVGRILDTDPAISPDGRSLVFRRDLTPFTGEMYRVPLGANLIPAGEPTRLTDNRVSANRPTWMPDSREIVFAARGSLWRLDAFSGGVPTRLAFVGLDGSAPAISRPRLDGRLRLVYVRAFGDTNIWRVDTTAAGLPPSSAPRMAIASTRTDQLPALSPDGKRMAFFSSRSGEFELWVGDPDGSNAVQLTSLSSLPGFARWSPDGETLTFHSDPEGHPDVLTIPANGGKHQILIPGPDGGGFPSFSRDGQWIYFSGTNAAGQPHIRKMKTSGGSPVDVTNIPGTVSIESYGGGDLYFLETAPRPSALWRLPLAGGGPTRVLEGVVNSAVDVVEGGIYYMDRVAAEPGGTWTERQTGKTRLQYFDFATRRITTVVEDLGTVGLGLSASRDGRTIFFARIDSSADELILVENFR